MIEVDALVALLTVEILLLLSVLLASLLIRRARTQRLATVHIEGLVDRVAAAGLGNPVPLQETLEQCPVDLADAQVQASLQGLAKQQAAFYRQVILAFLERDMDKLGELDQSVRELFQAQGVSLKALIEALSTGEREALQGQADRLNEQLSETEARLAEARMESARFSDALEQSRQALEEVSTEYTKMFGEPKTVERLLASQKRMLDAFERVTIIAGSPPSEETPVEGGEPIRGSRP